MSNLSISATEAASRYLGHRGYTVLETAWTCPAGTADIVAKDGDIIVFADVSSRDSAERGFPSESCGKKARTKRESIAIAWLAEHEDAVNEAIRFDNIALVVIGKDRAMIRHHINAFGADTASLVPEVPSIPTGADLQALPEAA